MNNTHHVPTNRILSVLGFLTSFLAVYALFTWNINSNVEFQIVILLVLLTVVLLYLSYEHWGMADDHD